MNKKTFLLLILDGFGIREETKHNAIAKAHMPTWEHLWETYPRALLDASGQSVGLPNHQIGNSEVGHMTIGAGRTVYQDLSRIDHAIQDKSFEKNTLIQKLLADGKHHPVHVMGLLSPGGVHSHEMHFFRSLQLLAESGCPKIYVHVFLDGRDVLPKSAKASLEKLSELCKKFPNIIPASLMGRYYAMDRDQRWDRTQLAYEAITEGKTSFKAPNLLAALEEAYARGETDEFVKPTWIQAGEPIKDKDIVFFINFRSDRTRQLSRAFLEKNFQGFTRKHFLSLTHFFSMTEYAKDIPTEIIFPPENLENSLGEYLAKQHLSQLRIAETEKYAHVTFFFNGGNETPFTGETRTLIPSAKVATYDLQPEMSAEEVTQKLVDAIESERFDFIVCNFANPDMLGHTGNFDATVKSMEALDACLKKIWDALKKHQGEMMITADHGNAECMFDDTMHQAHTAHTLSLVPLLYVGHAAKALHEVGTLADIAPSVLTIMGLPIPKEMTGHVMFELEKKA